MMLILTIHDAGESFQISVRASTIATLVYDIISHMVGRVGFRVPYQLYALIVTHAVQRRRFHDPLLPLNNSGLLAISCFGIAFLGSG